MSVMIREEVQQKEQKSELLDPEFLMDFGHMARFIGVPSDIFYEAIKSKAIDVPTERRGRYWYVRRKYANVIQRHLRDNGVVCTNEVENMLPVANVVQVSSFNGSSNTSVDFALLPATLSMSQMLQIFDYTHQTIVTWCKASKFSGSKDHKGVWGFDKASVEKYYREMLQQKAAIAQVESEKEAAEMAVQQEEVAAAVTSTEEETWTDQQAADYLDRKPATVYYARSIGRVRGEKNANTPESVMQYKWETQGTHEPGPNFTHSTSPLQQEEVLPEEPESAPQPTPVPPMAEESQEESEQPVVITPKEEEELPEPIESVAANVFDAALAQEIAEQPIPRITAYTEEKQPTTTTEPTYSNYYVTPKTNNAYAPAEPVRTTPTLAAHTFSLMYGAGQAAIDSIPTGDQGVAEPVAIEEVDAPRMWRVKFDVDGRPMVRHVIYTGTSHVVLQEIS